MLPKQGHRLSSLPQGGDKDAQLFAQSRTLQIRQSDGLDFSTVRSTLPLQSVAILTLTDFHEVSRAAGPKGQSGPSRMEKSKSRESHVEKTKEQ